MSYIVQLRFTDLTEAIDFYVVKLGCDLEFRYGDFYAGIRVADQLIHLKLVDTQEPNVEWVRQNEHLHLMFPVDDLDKTRQGLLARDVAVSSIRRQPWALDCTVIDTGGHTLYYSQFL